MPPLFTYNQGGTREDLSDVYEMLVEKVDDCVKAFSTKQDVAEDTTHKWVEGELGSNVSSTAAGGSAATAGSSVSVAVATGDGTKFRVGTLFRIAGMGARGGGYYRVTAISGNTLTCIAGPDGVDCPAYANGAAIQIIAHPALENATVSNTARTQDVIRTVAYNYTQIFFDYAEVTRTQEVVRKAGVTSEIAEQVEAKVKNMIRQMDASIIMGVRSATVGSASIPRMMGGLNYFLYNPNDPSDTNCVDASGAAISIALINRVAREIFADGGNPDVFVAHPLQKQKISQLYVGYLDIPHGYKEVGESVDTILTDFGRVRIIMDNQCPRDRVFMVDSSRVRFKPLRGQSMYMESVPPNGLVLQKFIAGEYTLEVQNGTKAHGALYNLSTS